MSGSGALENYFGWNPGSGSSIIYLYECFCVLKIKAQHRERETRFRFDVTEWELNQNGGAVWVQRNRAIMIQVFFNRQNQKALI